MKKIALDQAEVFNSDICKVTEYDFKDNDIDIATAVIKGRYPKKNYFINTKVKEMIYVVEGKGEIHKEKEIFTFKQGDAILIDKNEKYYWLADCKIVMSCSPAFFPEQHKIVE